MVRKYVHPGQHGKATYELTAAINLVQMDFTHPVSSLLLLSSAA